MKKYEIDKNREEIKSIQLGIDNYSQLLQEQVRKRTDVIDDGIKVMDQLKLRDEAQ